MTSVTLPDSWQYRQSLLICSGERVESSPRLHPMQAGHSVTGTRKSAATASRTSGTHPTKSPVVRLLDRVSAIPGSLPDPYPSRAIDPGHKRDQKCGSDQQASPSDQQCRSETGGAGVHVLPMSLLDTYGASNLDPSEWRDAHRAATMPAGKGPVRFGRTGHPWRAGGDPSRHDQPRQGADHEADHGPSSPLRTSSP